MKLMEKTDHCHGGWFWQFLADAEQFLVLQKCAVKAFASLSFSRIGSIICSSLANRL